MCNKPESFTAGEASLRTRLWFAFRAGAEAQKEIEQQEESRPPSVADGHWQAIAASITACQKMIEINDSYCAEGYDLKEAWENRIVELLKIVTTKQ